MSETVDPLNTPEGQAEFLRRKQAERDAAYLPLVFDEERFAYFASRPELAARGTGIYVRAKRGETWGSYDIAMLTRESLQAWLRSRGGENEWAESVVFILLGHQP